MNLYSSIIGIIIILILIGCSIIAMVILPRPKCFYDHSLCPDILLLTHDNVFSKIVEEIKAADIPVNSTEYIFNGTMNEFSYKVPLTYEALRCIPFLKKAFIVTMGKKEITIEKGTKYDNYSLRCAIPIDVSLKKCGIWVDGEPRLFEEKNSLIYDNSRDHSFFNKNKRANACILVIDIERPSSIAEGIC